MRAILAVVLLTLSASVAGAAGPSPELTEPGSSVYAYPSRGIVGILDPAKLSMSNEMSYFYSSGSNSVSGGGLGLYQNRLSYQVSDPLRVTLLLGYQFASPVGPTFGGDAASPNAFLPGLAVSYRPTDNLFFQFQYRKLSSASLWESPWSRDRYFLGD